MLKNGLEVCTCKKHKCERFGKCDECIEFHKTHKRYPLPQCMRKKKQKNNNNEK